MSEESVVLVGGRRNLPQIFVEHENSGQLRFRREGSVASDGPGSAGGVNQTSTPANYGIPGSYSTNFHIPPPPADHGAGSSPPSGLAKHLDQSSADSGYSGWGGDTVKKQRPQDRSTSYGSHTSEKSGDTSFWSIIASPVSDLKKKFKGRQSFIDDGPHFNLKIQPHHILAGIVGMVLLASVGFALLIGFRHFNLNNEKLNGKQRSIQYGTEKRAETLKKEGRLIEDDITDEAGNVLGGKRAAMQYAHNKVKREAGGNPTDSEAAVKVKVGEPQPLRESLDGEAVVRPVKPVESLSLVELADRTRELTLLLAAETSSNSPAATKLVKQIDALKARKRVLIAKLQESELASRANRVIRQDDEEADVEDDDEDDDDDINEENEVAEAGRKSREGLARVSQYEEAVAQLNELSDRLATAKSVGGGQVPAKAVVAKKENADVTETTVLEKPRRVRSPKTRFTNPLTGSLPIQGMSKAKREATKTQSPSGATKVAAGLPVLARQPAAAATDLKAELQHLEKRLTVLKEAVAASGDEARGEAMTARKKTGEDPDYPDLPTFRRTSPDPRKTRGRSKRQAKSQGGKFRKKVQPSAED